MLELTKKILMIKEPHGDGTFRYVRIPWDLMTIGLTSGLSPVPMPGNFNFVHVAAGTDIIPIVDDMLSDEDLHNDEIEEILWFESEQGFSAMFDNVTAYYKTNLNQSNEMGYPRV